MAEFPFAPYLAHRLLGGTRPCVPGSVAMGVGRGFAIRRQRRRSSLTIGRPWATRRGLQQAAGLPLDAHQVMTVAGLSAWPYGPHSGRAAAVVAAWPSCCCATPGVQLASSRSMRPRRRGHACRQWPTARRQRRRSSLTIDRAVVTRRGSQQARRPLPARRAPGGSGGPGSVACPGPDAADGGAAVAAWQSFLSRGKSQV